MDARGMMTLQQENERVYLDLYGLREPPFAITPDPEFLYLARTHQSALEKIFYGIGNRLGFMLLTGEVGTGKTTLCRHLLDLLRDQARTVYIVNPSLTVKELLAAILDDLGVPYPARATKKNLVDLLNRFLLGTDLSRPVVIIIDDAQAMSEEAMENLRLLSNLETDKVKLLQVLLAGQPELEERIGRPELRQLRQRVSLHCRLELLTRQETEEYISRRLITSGSRGNLRFSPKALDLVQGYSAGVPRLINKICDYALVAGYVDNDFTIAPAHVQRAVQETGTPSSYPVENGWLRQTFASLRATLFGHR
jgi:general secretion pathway protein A